MEQIKPNHLWGANFEARTVKDIIEQRITELSIDAVADRLVAWLDKWVFTPLLGVGGRAVD